MPRHRRADRADLYQRPGYLELQARLAVRVRRLREELALSQEEAAKRCGLTKQQIQRIEAAGSNVSFVTLARVAAGFELDPAQMIAPVKVPERLLDPERPGRDDRVPHEDVPRARRR